MNEVNILADYISLDKTPKSWLNCFGDIKGNYRSDWLEKYDFDNILNYYGLDNEFKKRLFKELDLLKQDEKLNFICFIMHYILFKASLKDYNDIWSWQSTKDTFKNHGSFMIPVIALLCGYEFHVKNMQERGYDDEQISIQKYNIRNVCLNDRKIHNIDGIRFSQMIWGSFFMKGYLIQVGRLQYEIGDNPLKIKKYIKENCCFVYIHIPKGDVLKEEDVNASLNNADKYIRKYFKESLDRKIVYYTESWLLSPELKESLLNSSNIIKFQNKFDIVESEENIKDFLNFVFNDVLDDIKYDQLPENTSLQKALKKKILNKEKLHLGLGILKKE